MRSGGNCYAPCYDLVIGNFWGVLWEKWLLSLLFESLLGGCYWCSSAIICWLPANYLDLGNEAHTSVISPVTRAQCIKPAPCETALTASSSAITSLQWSPLLIRDNWWNRLLCWAVAWLKHSKKNLAANSQEWPCKDIGSDFSPSLQAAGRGICYTLQHRQREKLTFLWLQGDAITWCKPVAY